MLGALCDALPVEAVLAHEETGNAVTYARDLRVARGCRRRGVRFEEFRQHGVFRPSAGRDGWAARWEAHMRLPRIAPPERFASPASDAVASGDREAWQELAIGADSRAALRQRGGSDEALRCLRSFLLERGRDYRSTMGSPVHAWESCSRLSPHLAWGTMSVRRAYQAARLRLAQLGGDEPGPASDALLSSTDRRLWTGSVRSFVSRLSWHCHFIQKLEDDSFKITVYCPG
ncbi:MAG: hypothetical protein ACKOYN_11885 [Planctomycetota bacterium]